MRFSLPALLAGLLILTSCSSDADMYMTNPEPAHVELNIGAAEAVNREFAFTDKKSGYFYGMTHGPGRSWHSGWNINMQRIFNDYILYAGEHGADLEEISLKRNEADVTLRPHVMQREYPRASEELYLFDDTEVIEIRIISESDVIGIRLVGDDMLSPPDMMYNYAVFTLKEAPGKFLVLAPVRESEITLVGLNDITAPSGSGGFLLAVAGSETEGVSLVGRIRSDRHAMLDARKNRMEKLLADNRYDTGVEVADQALAWNRVSLDALIMNQTGLGIYAGLPWFNDYWGRDIFISLPGAALVNGRLDIAANILRSFAAYQNTDEDDTNYGRIPNRLRPGEAIYNAADCTPRFVDQICEYLDYGGEKDLATELFGVVERATEGAIRHHMDESGYLTHGDSDTWMDAMDESENRAYSPRGNRANDIQALWYRQLRCAARLARLNDRPDVSESWESIAERVRDQFQEDFFDDRHTYMADRITYRGVPSFSMRPNQLFALDLINDPDIRNAVTREVWERLVYPWGTASLDQDDINFHPWHIAPQYYPKDAAYHNGIVWIWTNGIAMQRMIEAGQPDIAWDLFVNMSEQTVHKGGAGTLAENTDALPGPGLDEPRLSGTFTQAWSSAEYLRVWVQYFLGIRPGRSGDIIILAPRLPEALSDVAAAVQVAGGELLFNFNREKDSGIWQWRYSGERELLRLSIDMPGFETTIIDLKQYHSLLITAGPRTMHLHLFDSDDMQIDERKISSDPQKRALQDVSDIFFENTTFAEPRLRNDLRSLGGSRME
jgi:glycogen debranching enzyme